MAVLNVNPFDVQYDEQAARLRFPVRENVSTGNTLANIFAGDGVVSPLGNPADQWRYNVPKLPKQPKRYEVEYLMHAAARLDNSVTAGLDPKVRLSPQSIRSQSSNPINYDGRGSSEDWIANGARVVLAQDSLERIQIPPFVFFYALDMENFSDSIIYAPSVGGPHSVILYLQVMVHAFF